jgi:hypothetical protein
VAESRGLFDKGRVRERRRSLVMQLMVRGVVERREIQAMLARPVEDGGIRNPNTGEPFSLGTIQSDVAWAREIWKREAEKGALDWLGQELAKLDEVEAQAWRQWQASQQRERTKIVTRRIGDEVRTTTTRETLLPERGYLETILECVAKRARMLGLDKGDGVTVGIGVNVSQQAGGDVIEVREYLGE